MSDYYININGKIYFLEWKYVYAFSFPYADRDKSEIDDEFATELFKRVLNQDKEAQEALEYLSKFNYTYYKAHEKENELMNPDYGANNARNRCIMTVRTYTEVKVKNKEKIKTKRKIKQIPVEDRFFDTCALSNSVLQNIEEFKKYKNKK